MVDYKSKAKAIIDIISFMDYTDPLCSYNIEMIKDLFFIMFDDILTDAQLDNLIEVDENNSYRLSRNGEFTNFFHNVGESLRMGESSFNKVIIDELIKYDRFEILIEIKKLDINKNATI